MTITKKVKILEDGSNVRRYEGRAMMDLEARSLEFMPLELKRGRPGKHHVVYFDEWEMWGNRLVLFREITYRRLIVAEIEDVDLNVVVHILA